MEIKSLRTIGDKVYFSFVCENCKREVGEGDNYCRSCGRKLEQMNRVAMLPDISSILTAVLKDKPLPPKKKEEDDRTSDEIGYDEVLSKHSTTANVDGEDDDWVGRNGKKESVLEPTAPICPGSRKKKAGCPLLQSDGSCHGIVCPTYPPQYPKCVFEGTDTNG